jgi:hypothetical protein
MKKISGFVMLGFLALPVMTYGQMLAGNDVPTAVQMLGLKDPTLACGSVTNSKYVTVDWSDATDADGIAGYNYVIDYPLANGTGRSTWSTFFTASEHRGSLNEGTHHIQVRAKDRSGNYSEFSDPCSITLDTIAPKVEILQPAEGAGIVATTDIKGTVQDANLKGYALTVKKPDGTVLQSVTGDGTPFADRILYALDPSVLPSGEYSIELRAEDLAGQASTAVRKITVKDEIKPQVEILSPQDGGVVSGTVSFQGTVKDANLKTYMLSIRNARNALIDSSGKTDGISFVNVPILDWGTVGIPNGLYTIRLEAEDTAGHKAFAEIKVNLQNAPTDKDQCKNSGWKNFTYFGIKNQGSCVSHVESNEHAEKG